LGHTGAVPSAESFLRYSNDATYRDSVHLFIDPAWIISTPSRFCPQQTEITLNHRAELERCCVSWTSDSHVSLFEADLSKYLTGKLKSDFCTQCMASGYSYYKHFAIARPELMAHATAARE
jgi:hypothetical protein